MARLGCLETTRNLACALLATCWFNSAAKQTLVDIVLETLSSVIPLIARELKEDDKASVELRFGKIYPIWIFFFVHRLTHAHRCLWPQSGLFTDDSRLTVAGPWLSTRILARSRSDDHFWHLLAQVSIFSQSMWNQLD